MDDWERKDLLFCVEGLGKVVKLENDEGAQFTAYEKGLDSLGCLQDLQRFLRRDDHETKAFHIQLGNWNIVSSHLLPMLASLRNSTDYVFEIVRLLVMITLPAEKDKIRDPTEYNRCLFKYKESFINKDILAIIMGISASVIAQDIGQRTQSEFEMLELILMLFRNLLCIPDSPSLSLSDEMIYVLEKEQVFTLLLHVGSELDSHEYLRISPILLEIWFFLFHLEDPLTLSEIPLSYESIFEELDYKAQNQYGSNGKSKDSSVKIDPVKRFPNQKDAFTTQVVLTSSSTSIPMDSMIDLTSSNSSELNAEQRQKRKIISSKGEALAAALSMTRKNLGKLNPNNLSSSSIPHVSSTTARHSRFGGLVVSKQTISAPKLVLEEAESQPSMNGSQDKDNTGKSDLKKKKDSNNKEGGEEDRSEAANKLRKARLINVEFIEPSISFSSKTANSITNNSTIQTIHEVLNPSIAKTKLISNRPGMKKLVPFIPTKSSSVASKIVLKSFAINIMEHCYAELMEVMNRLIGGLSTLIVAADADHYLWAIGFFPAFHASEYLYKISQNPAITSTTAEEPNPKPMEIDRKDNSFSVILDGSLIQPILDERTLHYLLEQLDRYETEKESLKIEICVTSLFGLIYALYGLHLSNQSENLRACESLVMKMVYNPELVVERLPKLISGYSPARDSPRYLTTLIETVNTFILLLERINRSGLKKLVTLKKRSKSTEGDDLTGGGGKEADDEETLAQILGLDHYEIDEEAEGEALGREEAAEEEEEEGEGEEAQEDGDQPQTSGEGIDVAKSKEKKAYAGNEENQEVSEEMTNKDKMDIDDITASSTETKIPEGDVDDGKLFNPNDRHSKLEKLSKQMELDNPDIDGDIKVDDQLPSFSDDDSDLDEFGNPKRASKEQDEEALLKKLQQLQRNIDEDAADREKYFDLEEYVSYFCKQTTLNALMYLLRNYKSNEERTHKTMLSMFQRFEQNNGIAMFFQITHLKIFLSILNDPRINTDPSLFGISQFVNRVVTRFLKAFQNDPITVGISSLWPKKLNYAQDLIDGNYLTLDSLYTGDLEEHENRYRRVEISDDEETYAPDIHVPDSPTMDDYVPIQEKSNKSNISKDDDLLLSNSFAGTILKQKARSASKSSSMVSKHPQVDDFDLNEVLTVQKTKSREERIEDAWKEKRALKARRIWTQKEDEQLWSSFSIYKDIEGIDVIDSIVSMFEPEEIEAGESSDSTDRKLDSYDVYFRLIHIIQQKDHSGEGNNSPTMLLETSILQNYPMLKKPELDVVVEKTVADSLMDGGNLTKGGITLRMIRDQMRRSKQKADEEKKKTKIPKKKRSDMDDFIVDGYGSDDAEEAEVLKQIAAQEAEEKAILKGLEKDEDGSVAESAIEKKATEDDSDDDETPLKRKKNREEDDEAFVPGQVLSKTKGTKKRKVPTPKKLQKAASAESSESVPPPKRKKLVSASLKQKSKENGTADDESDLDLDMDIEQVTSEPTTDQPLKRKMTKIIEEDE